MVSRGPRNRDCFRPLWQRIDPANECETKVGASSRNRSFAMSRCKPGDDVDRCGSLSRCRDDGHYFRVHRRYNG